MLKRLFSPQPPEEKYLWGLSRAVFEMIQSIVKVDSSRTVDFLKGLTQPQLEGISEALTGYEERPEAEQSMIRYIVKPLVTGEVNHTVLYETLMLHDAFIGEALASGSQYRMDVFAKLVVGLREHLDTPLDLSTPEKRRDAKALISFSFEVETHGAEFMKHYYNRVHKLDYMRYESDALKELVLRFADQSEKLIETALRRETTDPELLALMMDKEQSSVLNSGTL